MSTQNPNSNTRPIVTEIPLDTQATCLSQAWSMALTAPDAYQSPLELSQELNWHEACVPGTVAMCLTAASQTAWNPPEQYDDYDCWYQCRFLHTPQQSQTYPLHLRFDGLATLSQIWLNGKLILSSNNMFQQHIVDIGSILQDENHLVMVFKSLNKALKQKRPRPRWKTNLVNKQQLRWFRTTLLGRIPGWAGSVNPVGPWRSIRLTHSPLVQLLHCHLVSYAENQQGRMLLNASISCDTEVNRIEKASIKVADQHFPILIQQQNSNITLTADLTLTDIDLWWPHTHGIPALYNYVISLSINNTHYHIASGKTGFKQTILNNNDTCTALTINQQQLFCRGACWTHNDYLSLQNNSQTLRQNLTLAKQAGVNMLRVGGTMVYESDEFYNICDELGIMIWQDFMFANMDYPIDDAEFERNIQIELQQQIQRLSKHACISLYCGNSEVEQQATMMGMDESTRHNRLFYAVIPHFINQWHHSIPYTPSTPHKGILPFHSNIGFSHYFAVGAYQRPLNDPSLAQVKFTSECLGLSNIPCDESLHEHFASPAPATHHPNWKQGVPRDNSAGWDFEDIRNHYCKILFKLDPTQVRYADNQRYIALSQIVSGEVMTQVFSKWRAAHSNCHGALVWFFKDLLPGAGWGIIDSSNRPKPVYYYLKRIWSTHCISITDEGLEGLLIHINNETGERLDGKIEITLLQHCKNTIATAQESICLNAYQAQQYSADKLLGRFYDTSYAYRFGPAKHDVVIATVKNQHNQIVADAYYFPNGLNLIIHEQADIQYKITQHANTLQLTLQSDRFLQAVQITIRDYQPSDNYFHLPPGEKKIYHTDKNRRIRQKL